MDMVRSPHMDADKVDTVHTYMLYNNCFTIIDTGFLSAESTGALGFFVCLFVCFCFCFLLLGFVCLFVLFFVLFWFVLVWGLFWGGFFFGGGGYCFLIWSRVFFSTINYIFHRVFPFCHKV